MGPQARQLHQRLRDLRERAEAARRAQGHSCSQKTLEAAVQSKPGGEGFRGQQVSDWAAQTPDGFKIPQAGSDDRLVAVVTVWADWAGEPVHEKWWRNRLERVREEQADERQRKAEERPRTLETVRSVGARTLEVHAAVHPEAADRQSLPELTPYLARAHDTTLRELLRPSLDGGPSVFVVLTGDSSTGKTRALYEALIDMAADRPLLRPFSAEQLLEQAASGQLASGSVLWLNEAQRFLYGPAAEQAAAQLRDTLERQQGITVVGTLWRDPYWMDLTRDGVSGDTHGQARALLASSHTREIPVPAVVDEKTRVELRELALQSQDDRLADALDAGRADGHIVQHLSGGPQLLDAFLRGPDGFFTRLEHAVICAAIDARRLGHHLPLKPALLQEAADGALPARYRPADADWCAHTLQSLSSGMRPDGTRTDVRRTLLALIGVRDRAGAPARYEPADYLLQHVRGQATGQEGRQALWEAMLTHTDDPGDLESIASAAWEELLHKQAVLFLRKAFLAGSRSAAVQLLQYLSDTGLDPQHQAAQWAAAQAEADDSSETVHLMRAMVGAGAGTAALTLAKRVGESTAIASFHDPADWIRTVTELGLADAVQDLAERIVRESEATDDYHGYQVGRLIDALRSAGATAAAMELTHRNIALMSPDDSDGAELLQRGCFDQSARRKLRIHLEKGRWTVSRAWYFDKFVQELCAAGESDLVPHVAVLAADRIGLADPHELEQWLTSLHQVHPPAALRLASRAATDMPLPKAAWEAKSWLVSLETHELAASAQHFSQRLAETVDVTSPRDTAALLEVLREQDQHEAAKAVLARTPDRQACLDDPSGVARLLIELRETSAEAALSTLLSRSPATHVSMADAAGVRELLGGFAQLGAADETDTLAQRAITHVDLANPEAVADVITGLAESGAHSALRALLARDPAAHVRVRYPARLGRLIGALKDAGATNQIVTLVERACAAQPQDGYFGSWDAAGQLSVLRDVVPQATLQQLAGHYVAHTDLRDLHGMANLIWALSSIGARDAMAALLDRDPIVHVDLNSYEDPYRLMEALEACAQAPELSRRLALRVAMEYEHPGLAQHYLDDQGPVVRDVAVQLAMLRRANKQTAMCALARRVASRISVDDPASLVRIIRAFNDHDAGAVSQALALHIAESQPLDGNRTYIGQLREALRTAGAHQAVALLDERIAAHGDLDDDPWEEEMYRYYDELERRRAKHPYGCDLDGRYAAPWRWRDTAPPPGT